MTNKKIRLLQREREMLQKGFVSARMVAYKTGLHRATIRLKLREGIIPSTRVGIVQFIKITDLQHFLGSESAQNFNFLEWDE